MSAARPMIPVGPWKMLPAAEGTCAECATKHEPAMPHNAQSLFYQYAFAGKHQRWPDWRDAMAHCSEEMKAQWTSHLVAMGVDVAGGKVNPTKAKV